MENHVSLVQQTALIVLLLMVKLGKPTVCNVLLVGFCIWVLVLMNVPLVSIVYKEDATDAHKTALNVPPQ